MEEKDKRFFVLLNRAMEGVISDDDATTLRTLADSDERYAALYEACLGTATAYEDDLDETFDAHWKKIQTQQSAHPVEAGTPKIRPLFPKWARYAAAVIVLMIGTWYTYQYVGDHGEKQYVTQPGERMLVELPDGTSVRLNGGSTLVLQPGFGRKERKVTFNGEGFFDVKKDEKRTFSIDLGETTVNVLGTTFNLRAYENEDRIETALISGKVELTFAGKPNQDVIMTPGRKVSIYKQAPEQPVSPVAEVAADEPTGERIVWDDIKVTPGQVEANEILWTENKLVFDGDDLDRVAAKLQQWYGVEVVVGIHNAQDNLKLSGIFEDMPLDTVLQTIQRTGSMRYERDGDKVVLRPQNP